MEEDPALSESLQHPRRSLGNRYRSQAEKFLKLNADDLNNLSWAEQSAKQSVLYDFTNEENWRTLIGIKVLMKDSDGARSVLSDLFSVLGRDPELMSQLSEIDIIDSCEKMLEGVFSSDPLDPDKWWGGICDKPEDLVRFSERLRGLDISDQRANILFSRRLQRLRTSGFEDEFLELSKILLSQRPTNHESWEELGMMYERRGEFDEAWLCYDQANVVYKRSSARERFRERMESRVGGLNEKPWREPSIKDRSTFLYRLGELSKKEELFEDKKLNEESQQEISDIDRLREQKKDSEAFFLARRLAAEGVEGAKEMVTEILRDLDG
tara:strand:- start:3498 stop:4472 length:975 start_codon:yes stop_codon:yes gene_type:complete